MQSLVHAVLWGLLALTASCADDTARQGTRAYAIHKGLRGEQIDEHVRNYGARGFLNKDGRIELEPGKEPSAEDHSRHWKENYDVEKGEWRKEYDPPGLLDSFLSGDGDD